MTGREQVRCSCGKPFPEDGGAEGVCECCSGCGPDCPHPHTEPPSLDDLLRGTQFEGQMAAEGRACLNCGSPLAPHRVALGLTYCTGRCYAALYQSGPTPTPEQVAALVRDATKETTDG